MILGFPRREITQPVQSATLHMKYVGDRFEFYLDGVLLSDKQFVQVVGSLALYASYLKD